MMLAPAGAVKGTTSSSQSPWSKDSFSRTPSSRSGQCGRSLRNWSARLGLVSACHHLLSLSGCPSSYTSVIRPSTATSGNRRQGDFSLPGTTVEEHLTEAAS